MIIIKSSEVIKTKAHYKQHSIKDSGIVYIDFEFNYDELTNVMMLNQMLNNNISIAAKKPNEKPFDVGNFMIKKIITNGDGSSKVSFSSIIDNVNEDSFTKLFGEEVALKMVANIVTE